MTKPTEEILLNETNTIDARKVACHMREIIRLVGEDPNREGLRKTPERFEKALRAGDFPIELSEIRTAADPLHSTAKGTLVAALCEA